MSFVDKLETNDNEFDELVFHNSTGSKRCEPIVLEPRRTANMVCLFVCVSPESYRLVPIVPAPNGACLT